jgi:hypothetical protein
MAEHQRIQAEFSKRVADTLSYVALGRSLGSLSVTQSQLTTRSWLSFWPMPPICLRAAIRATFIIPPSSSR